jgi:starch phosphorylase
MELWRVHQRRRLRLVFFARKRLEAQLRRRGAPPADISSAEEVLDPYALTIGFSRRFATYKRGTLLLRHIDRLKKLCNNPQHPVQFIFSGKAHPQDSPGKEIIKELVRFGAETDMRMKFVFLENYDINVARYMVQGCDVWLNTPRRPKEASGTSGMKAAANGVLNCSVLDGWWAEAANLDVGWTVGAGEEYDEKQYELADEIESLALFDLLEREIVPLFYERDRNQLPRDWIKMMKNSIRELGPRFNTDRMVCQYIEDFYLPAAKGYDKLAENGFQGARDLAAWRGKIENAWKGCVIKEVKHVEMENFRIGDSFPVTVWVDLNNLEPGDVMVQLQNGTIDSVGNLVGTRQHLLKLEEREEDGRYRYAGEIHCSETGRQGFALRIMPHHKDMAHCFRPGWVRWY